MKATGHARHVLLADDDKDDVLLFAEVLGELLHAVAFTSVNDGEELIRLLQQTDHVPDILFLDLNMPGKNGLDCLRTIKQLMQLQQVPVVIVSTSYELKMVDQLYALGAQYYIRKPNDFITLKHVIGQVLALTASPQQLPLPRHLFELLS